MTHVRPLSLQGSHNPIPCCLSLVPYSTREEEKDLFTPRTTCQRGKEDSKGKSRYWKRFVLSLTPIYTTHYLNKRVLSLIDRLFFQIAYNRGGAVNDIAEMRSRAIQQQRQVPLKSNEKGMIKVFALYLKYFPCGDRPCFSDFKKLVQWRTIEWAEAETWKRRRMQFSQAGKELDLALCQSSPFYDRANKEAMRTSILTYWQQIGSSESNGYKEAYAIHKAAFWCIIRQSMELIACAQKKNTPTSLLTIQHDHGESPKEAIVAAYEKCRLNLLLPPIIIASYSSPSHHNQPWHYYTYLVGKLFEEEWKTAPHIKTIRGGSLEDRLQVAAKEMQNESEEILKETKGKSREEMLVHFEATFIEEERRLRLKRQQIEEACLPYQRSFL